MTPTDPYVATFQVDTTTIEFALRVLEPEPWTPTPLLQARAIGERLRASVWLKREDCTPTGSFKLRGALTTARALSGCTPDSGVYVASAGNYGAAVVYACARYGIPVTVVAPEGATASKLDRIRLYGGKIDVHGRDFDEAKAFTREEARRAGAAFWEDGVIEQMAVGAGAIGAEILTGSDPWDMVIVPLGNGSLIKGIAREVKRRSPDTRIVAAAPEGAPAMARALRGETGGESAKIDTIADGLAVRVPIPGIVSELAGLIDDVWTASESDILRAVRTLMELEQVMAEPSAAVPIAVMVGRAADIRGKRIAAIITGSHLSVSLLSDLASTRGLL